MSEVSSDKVKQISGDPVSFQTPILSHIMSLSFWNFEWSSRNETLLLTFIDWERHTCSLSYFLNRILAISSQLNAVLRHKNTDTDTSSLYGLPSGFRSNLSLPSPSLRKKDMSVSLLVATSCRPSLGHVVYIHTLSICSLLERALVTTAVTAATFKLSRYENFENWNFMPQVSGIKLRHFLMPLADYSFKQRIATPNKIIGKNKTR